MDVTGKGTAWQKLTNVSEDYRQKMFDNVKREFIQEKGDKSSQHIVDDLPPRLLTLIPYPHRITVKFFRKIGKFIRCSYAEFLITPFSLDFAVFSWFSPMFCSFAVCSLPLW